MSPLNKFPDDTKASKFIRKSPGKDENVLGTQTLKDNKNDVLIMDNSTPSVTSLNLPNIESQEKVNESEDRFNEASESEESDSTCNSDTLPDLNDPTWGNELKQKVKVRRKKKTGYLKTHPQLMKNARKAFEHKAFMYKLSKEFIRNSKTTKEIENVEPHEFHKDKVDYQCASKASDDNLSNMMPELFPSRPVTAPNRNKCSSAISTADIISLKVKESLARYTDHEKSSLLSKDSSGVGLQSSNVLDATYSKEKANQQDKSPEVVHDSYESDSTVIYEDPNMQDLCHIESVQSLSMETSVDDNDLITVAENTNKQKRKDSSLGIGHSEGGNKKLRKDQQITQVQNDVNEHPMVMIPFNVSDQQYCSDKPLRSDSTSSPTHKLLQTQNSLVVSTSASQPDNVTCIGNKESSSAPIQEKESSILYSHLSKVSDAEFTQNFVRKQITGIKPTSASQEECITVLDDNTSSDSKKSAAEGHPVTTYNSTLCEDGKNSDQDVLVIDKAPGKAVDHNQTPKRLNLVAEGNDQEKRNHDLKKVEFSSVEKPLKSLTQMSLQFKELRTKRIELEDKIRQVKEEYEKALEALEEQKKTYDLDIKNLIDGMSAWKEPSEGDQLSSSDEQQEGKLFAVPVTRS